MKVLFYLSICVFCFSAIAQDYDPTPEQIADEQRFEKAKKDFLDGRHEMVLNYFDSVVLENKYARFAAHKMAYESCKYLESTDSMHFRNKAFRIKQECLRWHGQMQMDENWDSLQIREDDKPEVFHVVDETAQFPGGIPLFYEFIQKEMKYPEEAIEAGIEGKVYVQFIVDKSGKVDAVNTLKGIGGGCDEEAERVIRNSPNFIPAKQNGRPVYQRMVLPMIFKLPKRYLKQSRKAQKRTGL